ncbi:hypothetical protein TNCV_2234171 [Trichonephila clavipes]|nr:hypothetical protein TNCV_2234171 [Trichonephila clavipes]
MEIGLTQAESVRVYQFVLQYDLSKAKVLFFLKTLPCLIRDLNSRSLDCEPSVISTILSGQRPSSSGLKRVEAQLFKVDSLMHPK